MQEFFTFYLDTEMIGLNLIFNTLWDLQLYQGGRILLSAIGLVASLFMFAIIFIARFSTTNFMEDFSEKYFALLSFFTQFFFIPAWWGGFVFLFVSTTKFFG